MSRLALSWWKQELAISQNLLVPTAGCACSWGVSHPAMSLVCSWMRWSGARQRGSSGRRITSSPCTVEEDSAPWRTFRPCAQPATGRSVCAPGIPAFSLTGNSRGRLHLSSSSALLPPVQNPSAHGLSLPYSQGGKAALNYYHMTLSSGFGKRLP